jgi:hypothetical protein
LVTSLVIETIPLLEDLPPSSNGLFGLFDDIIGLEENLNCSVVTNHLRRCDGYGIVQEIFT